MTGNGRERLKLLRVPVREGSASETRVETMIDIDMVTEMNTEMLLAIQVGAVTLVTPVTQVNAVTQAGAVPSVAPATGMKSGIRIPGKDFRFRS